MSTDKYSSDFALAAGQSVKERDYWLKKLSGNLEKTILPYDSDRIEPKPGEPEMTTFQISGELFTKLNWISNNTDILLLAVLAGAINLLINKYTENTDIIIGMPIYKQSIEGDFINTVLAIRTQLHPKMTFKELLYQVKTAIDEAVKNQNYPIKALLYDLGLPYNEEDFPLFDITLTVENLQDRKYITHLHTHINFSFLRTDRYLEGKVAYDSLHYRKDTVASIIDHFTGILREAINNVNTGLSQISPLSEIEKKRLMEEFNNTRRDFPDADKKLPGIFADQVERTPDQIALVFDHIQLSYRGFNEKADRLAGLLCGKGIGTHCIAALLMESSPAIPISIMGVLKAGGAYLPIDPDYPQERIDYMLKDSGTRILINKSEIRNSKLRVQTNPNVKNSNDQKNVND
ncbi:MAG TPA: condensation domain-containing protein, partial [Candidatus Deferrimicrobium sp.]|nr:condensation domain-containing protein [Candidatus Deferrimicrobium sp.]